MSILAKIDEDIRDHRRRRFPIWVIEVQDMFDNADTFLIEWEPLKSYRSISHEDSLLYYGDTKYTRWKPIKLPTSPRRRIHEKTD